MKTVFDPAARAELIERMGRIPPDRAPLFGRMSAPQMVCHVSDALRAALGDLEVKSKGPRIFTNPIVRWLAIYHLPWPRGKTKTAPEYLTAQPAEWAADLATFRALMDRVAERGPNGKWAVHPLFGALSGKDTGALLWRHLDHHLQQFGV